MLKYDLTIVQGEDFAHGALPRHCSRAAAECILKKLMDCYFETVDALSDRQ